MAYALTIFHPFFICSYCLDQNVTLAKLLSSRQLSDAASEEEEDDEWDS